VDAQSVGEEGGGPAGWADLAPCDSKPTASTTALATLRDDVLPSTLGKLANAEYAVTGITANSHDFNQAQKSSIPKVFGFVLLFAFALLLATFRSVVIALKAIVLNLLSVAAAYGVIVAIFSGLG
jgi:uncharacterized membrane protein YdfJ with MMPL/SSD domain